MTYTEDHGTITLQMTEQDYDNLLLIIGIGTGSIQDHEDPEHFWYWVNFVNRMNATNPSFQQYEIPKEYQRRLKDSEVGL